jgi:hypothetical protein
LNVLSNKPLWKMEISVCRTTVDVSSHSANRDQLRSGLRHEKGRGVQLPGDVLQK